jgi:hypothetical protein
MERDQARLPERTRHLYEQTLFGRSLPTPLLFRTGSVGDLLGDQRGVAAGTVVDNEVHPDLVFYSLKNLFDETNLRHSRHFRHFLLTDTFLFRKVDPFGGAQRRLLKG